MPLAMADIYTALVCMIRPWIKDPDALKVPKRSQVLRDWCLPMLSKSVAEDEKESEALALFNSVKKLKERYAK